jgi:hypothetical protein
MPFKSPAQRRLMEGINHGWVPDRIKRPPSKQVAAEFVDADKKARRKRGRGIGAAIGKSLDTRGRGV